MKMYVWANPYEVDYGNSIVIAVAESLEQAKAVAKSGKAYTFIEFDEDEKSFESFDLGEPIRVLECPCAEWHEFKE
jgi:hypothetical protein